ncbi:MAG: hypothetical protein ACI9FN_000526 [Saprospiraceae bacterium]|jgi:hypothetical protein
MYGSKKTYIMNKDHPKNKYLIFFFGYPFPIEYSYERIILLYYYIG